MVSKKGTVRPLNIPPEKIQEVNEMLDSKNYSPYMKKHIVKENTGHSSCLLCGRLPELQITHEVGDEETPLRRVMHYCSRCWEIDEERYKKEPQTRGEIAAFYNCQIAPEGTFGGSTKGYSETAKSSTES